MAVRVEIEIPVAVVTTTQTGNNRVVHGNTVIDHEFEELDEDGFTHVASVQSRRMGQLTYYKHEEQFYRIARPRPDIGERLPAIRTFYGNMKEHEPSAQSYDDIKHLFNGVPTSDISSAWYSGRDYPKDIGTVRRNTYDQNQLTQQIEIRRAALDHVIVGRRLLKPIEEPYIYVDDGVCVSHLSPTMGRPGRCFSFAELDDATELARRLEMRQYGCDTFEILEGSAFSDTYLTRRMASVLDEVENVFSKTRRVGESPVHAGDDGR